MTGHYVLFGAAFALVSLGLLLIEAWRTRRAGVDVISVFMFLFALQCAIPGILLFGLLPWAGSQDVTGVPPFDRILESVDSTTILAVWSFTAVFALFVYVGLLAGRGALNRYMGLPATADIAWYEVTIKPARLMSLLAFGGAFTLLSFWSMGDSLLERYAQLIQFRAYEETVGRTAFNSFAFSLTQTWAWLSVFALFAIGEQKRSRWILVGVFAAMLVFAVLGASRRAIFIPLMMCFLVVVLRTSIWRLRWIALAAVPLLLIVAFGKMAFAAIAWGGSVQEVATSYESWVNAVVRAAADLGITLIESMGTFQYIEIGPRFGVDHLLSIANLVPEGSLGIAIDFPERIVRISTEAFADPSAQDIPPGLLGQMWLDFGAAGPVLWGLFFGLQLSIVQHCFERVRRTYLSAAFFVLITFVLALPLNSGSFDFTFSVDIVMLALALMWCVRFRLTRYRAYSTADYNTIVSKDVLPL